MPIVDVVERRKEGKQERRRECQVEVKGERETEKHRDTRSHKRVSRLKPVSHELRKESLADGVTRREGKGIGSKKGREHGVTSRCHARVAAREAADLPLPGVW